MTYICSTGLGIPNYRMPQEEVKQIVQKVFTYSLRQRSRLLPVFDNAQVNERQFVVDSEWFLRDHSFKERNELYTTYAKEYALRAIDACLTNQQFLDEPVLYEEIDMIIFVSSTGIATPSMDIHLFNERPFRSDIKRMPLWGLGCAGGAIGLSRAYDWLTANPDKSALIVCCELCSLTFQKGDMKKSNIIGTALFGDGISAALAVGEKSLILRKKKGSIPKLLQSHSYTKKDSISVMGWDITDGGFEVIFSKSIPALVETFWREHLQIFLQATRINEQDIHSFIAHPGGKKVIDSMEKVLQAKPEKFKHSINVLRNHGNMSSATVLYVLGAWMKEAISKGEKSVISALGPGFSSELILMEWVD
ncbi:MAG: type III polyketide synthase [Bacillota bacterium]|uniref:Type III polyketide synthase n=1 Tax=Virgibacillus salarius TaxID=447199 RepID=A0A941DWE2_9BACI|nr:MULTISPECIES: 3-oxoacyl-[acyl-carrier-protein] synthase III C-terminal domain-containing protein [Virgibacillus]MBR7796572.1 type III polyketide synthase [Virgibacillus salarius]NAZ09281.1 type III polyketide synthase [Agaribacter marinus]